MSQLTRLYKVVVVAETAMEEEIFERAFQLGAKGYTCVYCFGRGEHPVYEDVFLTNSQVRIEIVASRQTAEAILNFTQEEEFENRPITAYIETVEVANPEKFCGRND